MAKPATVLRTKPSVVLPLIRARIMAATGYPAERVFFCLESPPYDSQADKYVFLLLDDGALNEAVFEGSGRVDDRSQDGLLVCLRTRMEADEPDRANFRLMDHVDARHVLRSGLSGFQAEDAGRNVVMTKPMRVRRCKAPKQDKRSAEWCESWLVCLFEYENDETVGLG